MLQNAIPLRKSASGPPNIFDEHVSSTAPATENASCQILFKCPTPAIVFWKCYKTFTFCSLLTRCKIPCACSAKRHLNVQKCSVPVSFLHFWLGNVLRATTNGVHCFDISTWCALYILIWKRASRHNGMHFFDISTSKSGPNMVCFVHFDLEMCFAHLRATTACTPGPSMFTLRSFGINKIKAVHVVVQFSK